jgi:hypothetical protein
MTARCLSGIDHSERSRGEVSAQDGVKAEGQAGGRRHVAKQLVAAADGGDINDLVVPLLLVLQLERIECRLR